MNEFLNLLSNVFYIIFIISSIFFGISIAVRTLLVKTIKNISKESDKYFDNIDDNEKKSKSLEAIEKAQREYALYLVEVERIKKIEKQNKFKNMVNSTAVQEEIQRPVAAPIFLNLFKETATIYAGDRSHLSFSFGEIIEVSSTLTSRVNELLESTNVIWLKSIPLSVIPYVITAVGEVEKLKSHKPVFIALYVLDIALKISKLFSPIGAGNYLLTKALDGGISNLLSATILEVMGKEISYIYHVKSLQATNVKRKTA